MHLEIISRGDRAAAAQPHLVFIHGGFHAAWCWDEHILPWFAARGWQAHALSLRGHGASAGREQITQWSLDDYADDVGQVLTKLNGPAILIGHSMGGVVAQKCWDRFPAVAGMVLYASSPLRPDSAVLKRLLWERPFSLIAGQLFHSPSLQLRACEPFLFSPDLEGGKRTRYVAKLCPESPKALKEIFSRAPQSKNPQDQRPVLVIGGRDDWSIPLSSHEALATAFAAELKVCPGSHDLMLDPNWEDSARAIEDWLGKRFHKL